MPPLAAIPVLANPGGLGTTAQSLPVTRSVLAVVQLIQMCESPASTMLSQMDKHANALRVGRGRPASSTMGIAMRPVMAEMVHTILTVSTVPSTPSIQGMGASVKQTGLKSLTARYMAGHAIQNVPAPARMDQPTKTAQPVSQTQIYNSGTVSAAQTSAEMTAATTTAHAPLFAWAASARGWTSA
jgi:hypothetical protein